jgi:hypothetical protein
MTWGQSAILVFGVSAILVYVWYQFFDLKERIANFEFF